MHRPFRYLPPPPGPATVHRERLSSILAERFSVRLLTIEAGAGFGKTTLLAQSLAQGGGVDAYVSCDGGDAVPSRLLSAILTAVRRPPGDGALPTVRDVAEAAWALSPDRVAIVLDDLHWIDPSAPSMATVDELLRELPANASMVWAGRRVPTRGRARLLAQGQCRELGEADLAMTSDELAQLARAHGHDAAMFDDLAGWPALAELTARSGRTIAKRFVDDEIVSQLAPDDRHALIAAVAVGGGDAAMVEAAAAVPVQLERLARLPLVSFDEGVGVRPHHLWADLLRHDLASPEATQMRRRGADLLIGRGQFADAYELLAAAGDWTAALDVLVEACNDQQRPPSGDLLAQWRRSVPDDAADRAEVLYLEAMIERAADPWSARCRARIDAASRAFHLAGQASRALACNVRGTYVDWLRADEERQELNLTTARQAAEAGIAPADLVALTEAALCDSRGDTTRIRELTATELNLEARLAHMGPLYRVLAELLDGDPGRALPTAERAARAGVAVYPAAGSGFARLLPLLCAWSSGTLLAPDHPELVDPGPRLPLSERVPWLALAAVVAAHRLDIDRAEELCRRIDELIRHPEDRGLLAASAAVAHATVACARGDEAAAAATWSSRMDGLELHPTAAGRMVAWFPAVPYLLDARCRAWLDERASLGVRAAVLEGCRALLAARTGGPIRPLTMWDHGDLLLTSLPPPQAVELTIAAAAAGQPPAERQLHRLAESHPVLSRERIAVVPADRTRAQHLARLRREVAFAPAERLHVTAFGPLALSRGSEPIEHRDLRRERVRHLMAILLVHRSIRREQLGAMLWPDYDEASVSANLRQTLSYLQGVLEPQRARGEATWFIRQAAGVLSLRDDPTIDVDLWEVERHLDAAQRAATEGATTRQLSALLQAVERWSDDLLGEFVDALWLEGPRQRVRSRLVSACIRAGELLVAAGRHDEARSCCERALVAEPATEPAHRILISSHLADGDRWGARRAAERCVAALADVAVRPDAATAALIAQV